MFVRMPNRSIFRSAVRSFVVLVLAASGATFGQLIVQPPGSGGGGGSGTVTVVGSGTLTATECVTGGGASTVQTPSPNCTVDSSGNLKAASVASGSAPPALTPGNGGALAVGEGTVPTVCAALLTDCIYSDVTQHGFLASFNNGSYLPLPQGPVTTVSGHLATWSSTNGGLLADGGSMTQGGCPASFGVSIAALPASTANFNPCKTQQSLSLKAFTGVASGATFTCAASPVITLQDCGTSAGSCGSPTPLATVTLTAANMITDSGTTFPVTVASGHYLAYQITSGTCVAVPSGLSASAVWQ